MAVSSKGIVAGTGIAQLLVFFLFFLFFSFFDRMTDTHTKEEPQSFGRLGVDGKMILLNR